MSTRIDRNNVTAANVAIALNEAFPESSYGAIPVIDQRDALLAYLAFDDGAFDEVPEARAAYIDYQLRFAG